MHFPDSLFFLNPDSLFLFLIGSQNQIGSTQQKQEHQVVKLQQNVNESLPLIKPTI